jgi:hypothetical protein
MRFVVFVQLAPLTSKSHRGFSPVTPRSQKSENRFNGLPSVAVPNGDQETVQTVSCPYRLSAPG